MKKPNEAHANKDWTRGLDIWGPNIMVMNPLSAKSNDPDAKVKTPKTCFLKKRYQKIRPRPK